MFDEEIRETEHYFMRFNLPKEEICIGPAKVDGLSLGDQAKKTKRRKWPASILSGIPLIECTVEEKVFRRLLAISAWMGGINAKAPSPLTVVKEGISRENLDNIRSCSRETAS